MGRRARGLVSRRVGGGNALRRRSKRDDRGWTGGRVGSRWADRGLEGRKGLCTSGLEGVLRLEEM